MEIGKRLKEAREEQNITLESLQDETKIQKRYLTAIEEGNFHILPGTFYARAFIKEYANAVGLDPEELLAVHESELPATEEQQTKQYTRMTRSSRREQSEKSPAILSILPTIIVILLIVGIAFVGWTLYQKSIEDPTDANGSDNQQNSNEIIRNEEGSEPEEDKENNDSENNKEDNNDENESEEPEKPELKLTLTDTQPGTKPESTFDLIVPEGEELTVTFEPTGESWVDLENEDRVRLDGKITEADTPLTFQIEDVEILRINIGFASAVPVVKINDIVIDYPFSPDEFNTQRFWIHIKSDEDS